MSPTTKSSALIVLTSPSLITSQYLIAVLRLRFSVDFCMAVFVFTAIPVTNPITINVRIGPEMCSTPRILKIKVTIVITISITVIGSLRASSANSHHFFSSGSGSLLLPCSSRLRLTSSSVNPVKLFSLFLYTFVLLS